MCCAITILILFGPRLALLVWWLISPGLFDAAFGLWLWPLLFSIFAPFTMIFYMISWYLSPGVSGLEWILIVIGIALDLSSHTGAGYRHRDRFLRG
ncbi:MAG: hypothetical protein JW997_00715 [Actinobacteria bacterium]|nr:hypothetical protein [Actinomycetota bacterium]